MDRARYVEMRDTDTLPQVGDLVRLLARNSAQRALPLYQREGTIVSTFYELGEGGTHVQWSADRLSWVCCTDLEIIRRATT